MAQALLAGADALKCIHTYKSACAICWENIILRSRPEIEISFQFIPKILMSKECIHFFGPFCRCQSEFYFVLHYVSEVQSTARNIRMTGVLAKFGAVRFEPHAHQTAVRIESKLRCHTSELTSVTDFHRKANNSAMHVKHADPRTWRYFLRVHFMHFWAVLHENSDPHLQRILLPP